MLSIVVADADGGATKFCKPFSIWMKKNNFLALES